MSKLLVNLALLQTKAIVNAYTWTTLPFYALAQRPWHRLKLSRTTGVKSLIDPTGKVIYSRPSPSNYQHPHLKCNTYNEVIPLLDRSRQIFGVRDVLSEIAQLDAHGNPIKIDGKELKKVKLADEYRWYTVGEVLDRVDALARGLKQMGVSSGDKVIIYAENSFEWFCASIALQRINAITVTLLSILNDEGIVYGINQSEASFVIVSQDLLKRLNRISDEIKNQLTVVWIKNGSSHDPEIDKCVANLTNKRNYKVSTFDELIQNGGKLPPCEFPIPNMHDVALIMYTSGTTGNPKGVMLTHKNIMTGLHNLIRGEADRNTAFLDASYPAYLPMAHLYGYIVNLALFVSKARIGLCSSFTMLDSSPAHVPGQVGDFKLIKPEFLGGVPLVLDRILKEIYRKLNAQSPIAAPLFTYLMDYKIRWRSRGFDSPIINRLVCQKINDGFGGRLRTILTGSAPLNDKTQAMVEAALNVRLLQGYGSTEMTAASHIMIGDDLQYGECGVPLHSAQFYLKDWTEGGYRTTDKPNPRGEVVVGGDSIAAGYYKMEAETDECFKVDQNGVRWFESGDIGEVLPDGTLKIIDRKKDLTKLANGEFVSLGKIESGLRSSPYVENICVCSNPYKNYVTALITPNRRALTDLAYQLSKPHLTFEQQCDDPEIVNHIRDSLRITGQELGFSKKEIPLTIALVKEEWTQDNNLLTAAMKMKRKQVNDFYRKQIELMCSKE